jgi:hypothetical protein
LKLRAIAIMPTPATTPPPVSTTDAPPLAGTGAVPLERVLVVSSENDDAIYDGFA